MHKGILFPNQGYRAVLDKMVSYFELFPEVFAIALTGSLARGKAVIGSCIDLCVFLDKEGYKGLVSALKARTKAYSHMGGEICYYSGKVEGGVEFGDIRVDIEFSDGKLQTGCMSFDIVRDEFETTIGNLLVYCVPLFQRGVKYRRLRSRYLPFYGDALRKGRLAGTQSEFSYKTWKIQWLASRGEYLAALETLLEAQRIFLQHLFIKERKYPIDYVKWLKEQCETILSMPELYTKLADVVEGIKLSKRGIAEKAAVLEQIMQQYGVHNH